MSQTNKNHGKNQGLIMSENKKISTVDIKYYFIHAVVDNRDGEHLQAYQVFPSTHQYEQIQESLSSEGRGNMELADEPSFKVLESEEYLEIINK